jgi:hypothetical protein
MLLIKQLHLNIVVQIRKSKMILVQAWVSKLPVHILFSRKINGSQACYVDSSMDEAQPHLKFSFQKEN